jgi:Cu-processing system ATP-binding protein
MIAVKQLQKTFGKNEVLKGIDLKINKSGITILLGPNGSGKTTLLKCILGLVIPNSGDIVVEDKIVNGEFNYREKICHLPQIANFPENLTPNELINMMKDLKKGKTNEHYLVDIFDIQKELDKKMSTLSGGNRQKVNLMLSLMFDCPTIVLDEPTSGLDPLAIINLKKILKEERDKGKSILIITHIINFAEELADHVIFMLEGNIYFDGPLSLLLKEQNEKNLELAIAHILRESKITKNKALQHV